MNYEQAKRIIENNGDKLLAKKYVNMDKRMTILCSSCHESFRMSLAGVLRDKRCIRCHEQGPYEEAKKIIKDGGDELKSIRFKNEKDKMVVECGKCHKNYAISLLNFRNGIRCYQCNRDRLNQEKLDLIQKLKIKEDFEVEKIEKKKITIKGNNKSYTYEEVKKIIEKEGYELLSKEYVNAHTKLELKCHCGYEYWAPFETFAMGFRCRKCGRREVARKKRTPTSEIKELVESRGDEFLGILMKERRINVGFRCGKNCKDVFIMNLFAYQNRRISCHCELRGKPTTVITYDIVKQYIEKEGEELMSEKYVDSNAKLQIRCKKCHQVYGQDWASYSHGVRCGLCSVSKKNTFSEVKMFVEVSGDILLSKEYITSNTKLEIECGTCSYVFMMPFDSYKQGHRCRECAKKTIGDKSRNTQEEIADFIALKGEELVSDYTGSKDPIFVKCAICNNIYETTFNKYQFGTRCRCKITSNGERDIMLYLDKKNIKYEQQVTYQDCRLIHCLKFDFYLPKFDLLIEYDGGQHFKPVNWFGGHDAYQVNQKRDLTKNVFCFTNNQKLLRISCEEEDQIQKILDEYLSRKEHATIEYSNFTLYRPLIEKTIRKVCLG